LWAVASSLSSPLLVVIRRGGRDVARWVAVWWPCVLSWAVAALVSGVHPGGGVVGIGAIAGVAQVSAGGRRDMAAVARSLVVVGGFWCPVGWAGLSCGLGWSVHRVGGCGRCTWWISPSWGLPFYLPGDCSVVSLSSAVALPGAIAIAGGHERGREQS
jgi:hypothetical protein